MAEELFDKEAEQAVIGAILLAPESLHEIGELGAEDFYLPEWKALFSCCLNLWQRGEPVDNVSLLKEFEREAGAGVDTSGISILIATAGSQIVTASNISVDAHSIRSFAVRRRALSTMRAIIESLKDTTKPVIEVLDEARQSLYELQWLPSASRMVLFRDGIEIGGQDPIYEFNVIRPSDLKCMRINFKSAELDKPIDVRRLIREKLHLNPILPPAEKWGAFIHAIVSLSTQTQTPDALQEDGQIIFWMREWFKSATPVTEDADDLLNGYVERGDMYYIQPQRLLKWLDDHTKLKPTISQLWAVVQRHGAHRDVSIRIKKSTPRKLWGIPITFLNPREEESQLVLDSEGITQSDQDFLREFEENL